MIVKVTRHSKVGFTLTNNKYPEHYGNPLAMGILAYELETDSIVSGNDFNIQWFIKVKGKWYRELFTNKVFSAAYYLSLCYPTYNKSATKIITKYQHKFVDVEVEEVK